MYRDARKLPVQHLSVRLPWHDTGWTGSVCRAPSKNTWCTVLKGIREQRDDVPPRESASEASTHRRQALCRCRGQLIHHSPQLLLSELIRVL